MKQCQHPLKKQKEGKVNLRETSFFIDLLVRLSWWAPPLFKVHGLFADLVAGRTIARAYMNYKLSTTTIDGLTFDLGAGGSGNYKFMNSKG